ncbi:hypothetical protein E4U42_005644 [Claviceps africana]|uniref:Inclusion body clearance protein IML2 n=1 Tax=Claviceps africana TaxID=83212 RepID=A0A8K0J3Z1_9HYPO|nr:hypothetical protein E4U42_005644 [Claviceps africana]
MSLLSGWFRTSSSSRSSRSSRSLTDRLHAKEYLDKEKEHLADALKWTALVMNDDIDGAWQGLERGDSSFHSLGAAVTFFMRSVLGFEKEIMAETAAKLSDCEAKAWNDYKTAQKHTGHGHHATGTSRTYPPGTEYELVRAETQLMSAVVGVLNESVVEAMKSFYKLRKAFIILDGIMAIETKALEARPPDGNEVAPSSTNTSSSSSPSPTPPPPSSSPSSPSTATATATATDTDTDTDTATVLPANPNKATGKSVSGDAGPSPPQKMQPVHGEPDLDMTDPIDVFVHSGANMCFGLIHLVLSLVPPAFSRILSVVGFHGDRARGVRMLWRSAGYDNINGAIAGMLLLAYYNGLLGAVDIIPCPEDYDEDAEAVGPPHQKCRQLLQELRARYPDSRMWRVEESRLYANERDLPRAIELLSTGKQSAMKQVTAVNNFELGINAMILQNWGLMRDTFLLCLESSDWSPGFYYYLAGCAALELYRDAYHKRIPGNDSVQAVEIRRLKDQAEEYLRKVPQVSGKQRLMARQLPLEAFAQRKLQKWEARATTLGIDLADAVGPSPALEISYMWSGQKKMSSKEMDLALTHLDWNRCTAGPEVMDELRTEEDDVAVWAISMSSILQGMGKVDEAIQLLEQNVLSHDRSVFKGRQKDDYVLPVAYYELAVIAWTQCCNPPPELSGEEVLQYRRAKTDECQRHLERVKTWESFVLDARVGMRVQSGLETLRWFRRKMEWEA